MLPVATNDYVQSRNNNYDITAKRSNGDDNKCNSNRNKKKKSNVYRNGRGPCNIGEPTCGVNGWII